MFKNERKSLYVIFVLGIATRVIFTIFFAQDFVCRQNIYVDGDTSAWLNSIKNLIEHGTYTIDLNNDYGYFFRMPGYSFFIGLFFLITRNNLEIMYPLIGWVQILLDIFSIYLIYKISFKLFENVNVSLISGVLYATYPFIIVWTPVVYSESTSVFFLLLSTYLFIKKER